jgi:hypothetical protein
VVVEANNTEMLTPKVPLAKMFQHEISPASDNETPNTSTRGPEPMMGMNTAKITNGTSINMRLAKVSNGKRAISTNPKTNAA